MKTIVLIGDPNVGKSVLFSRLTGIDVISSNYPGTTVDFCKGRIVLGGEPFAVIDAPGTYSLAPTNKAEDVAVSLLDQSEIVINVIDATSLERSLPLTLELLEKRKRVIVALNMWDEASHLGIRIDVGELAKMLGVPVVPTVAITGAGVKELVGRIGEATIPDRPAFAGPDALWVEVGHIIRRTQVVAHRHHSLLDRMVDATVKPVSGLFTAIVVLSAIFWLIRFVGEGLIAHVAEPLFDLYGVPLSAFGAYLGPGILHDILIGRLFDGKVDFVQSMGVLSTGLFMPFGMVLPYIVAFYIALGFLEDSGYLPRLATVTDNLFHRLGMHGHGILPVLLGLGCKVPGVLSTRTLETRKQRFISIVLVGITIPCTAHTAMIFGILGHHGMRYVAIVLGTLAAVFVGMGLLLSRCSREETPELFLDIPPYRRPSLQAVAKKTWMRVRSFLVEALPLLFLGVFAAGVLDSLGATEWLAALAAPLMNGLFGLPGEAAPAIISGLLRKEMALGMLVPLELASQPLTVAVLISSFFPCIATLAVMWRELGTKGLGIAVLLMFAIATVTGVTLRLLLATWSI